MANVQKQFSQFHKTIRTDYDDNALLREKRDIVIDRITKYLKDNDLPQFDRILQGSYKTKTGIYPLHGNDYDIDVGLLFKFDSGDYSTSTVRGWVYEAVKNHTNEVIRKNPCIRVNYADNYHVDLVVYANDETSLDKDCLMLAHKTKGWIKAEPNKLIQFFDIKKDNFNNSDDGSGTDQLRRCIRYLKRWSDTSLSKPSRLSGLSILILAAEHSQRQVGTDGNPIDLNCLKQITLYINSFLNRISIQKPTQEFEDLLQNISDDNMEILKERFRELDDVLNESHRTVDPHEACTLLQTKFGSDFPVPPKEESSDTSPKPAIITSSNSAKK